nr:unnamed protein product [Callosobruchus analis]
MEWPRSAFERVHEEAGDVMNASWDHDLVSFMTSDFNMGKGVIIRFKERYQGLEELKAQAEKEPLELPAVPYMPTYKWNDVEKILEYTKLYRFERHRQNRKKKTIEPENQAQKGKMSSQKYRSGKETVIISGDGQSYADLRDYRSLEIKKGSADVLRSAINTQLKTGRASKITRQTVLHLRGLDSLTAKEEIMDTLKETYGEVTQRCRVTSMRPAYGESQNATTQLSRIPGTEPYFVSQDVFQAPIDIRCVFYPVQGWPKNRNTNSFLLDTQDVVWDGVYFCTKDLLVAESHRRVFHTTAPQANQKQYS